MGIKSINKILKEKASTAFTTLPLEKLIGKRIAIDANNWIYTRRVVVFKNEVKSMPDPLCDVNVVRVFRGVVREIVSFSEKLLQYGITPIWCFDGKAMPDKMLCKEKRAKSKLSVKTRIDAARAELESKPILLRKPKDIATFKKLLAQHNVMMKDEIGMYAEVITKLGLPCLVAEYEGEKLCASLSRENLVIGVWTTDTDCYPLGVKLMITSFEGGSSVNVVVLPIILQSLQFSHAKLVDFCITLGCDFNTNMYRYGPKRVWNLFEKYNTIEEIEQNEAKCDTSVLKHVRCREIFEYVSSGYNEYSTGLYVTSKKPTKDPVFGIPLDGHQTRLNRVFKLIKPPPEMPEDFENTDVKPEPILTPPPVLPQVPGNSEEVKVQLVSVQELALKPELIQANLPANVPQSPLPKPVRRRRRIVKVHRAPPS